MKKTYNVKINSILLYIIFIFTSNYLAYRASVIIANLFQHLVGKVSMALIAIFVFAIYILMGFAIPFITIFFFLKSVVWKLKSCFSGFVCDKLAALCYGICTVFTCNQGFYINKTLMTPIVSRV